MNQQTFDDDFKKMKAENAQKMVRITGIVQFLYQFFQQQNFGRSSNSGFSSNTSEDISSNMLYIILIPIGACVLIGIIALCIVFGCRIYNRRRYRNAYNGAGTG